MKKLYSIIMMLALMVAALSLTSCGGDDDEIDNGFSLVGVWECTYYEFNKKASNVYDESNFRIGSWLYLKSDGTYICRNII